MMKWRNAAVLPGIVLILPLFLAGCATKIKTTILCPGKAHEVATLKRIAVLPFSGRGGDEVGSDVEALLVGVRVNGEPYFSVIEREALRKIMKEQRLHLTGAVDEATAVKVGKLIGAQGIVFGAVTQNDTEDKRYKSQRSECARRDNEGKCTKRRKYSVSCTERNAYFSFVPKVVSVGTGQIVASEILTGDASDSACRDSGPLMGRQELLLKAKRQALGKFRRLIAPYKEKLEIVLIDDDESDPPDAAEDRIERGIEWAEAGRMDRACELWQEACRIHPKGYAVHYLLGVCAEISGDLEGALKQYQIADRLTDEPVEEINQALGRVRFNLEEKRKLEEQLQR